MTAEMRLMRETIDQQYAEIAKLNRNIEALNHQIRKKDEENARLKERLSKYEKPKKNSSNSSTPPSKESMKDEIVRRTKSLRKQGLSSYKIADQLKISRNTVMKYW